MKNRLVENLKLEYKKYKIEDSIFEEAANYSEDFKKAKLYIENYMIDNYEVYKEIIKENNEVLSRTVIQLYKTISVKEAKEIYDNIIESLTKKYDKKICIRENIRKRLKSYINKNTDVKKNSSAKVLSENKNNVDNYRDEYDITFLNSYIKRNHILLMNFSKTLNIESSELYKYLCVGKKISENKIKKIYKVFDVESYEELKEKTKENILICDKVDKEIVIEYDITFLKGKIKNDEIKKLAEELDVSKEIIQSWLNGKSNMKEKYLNKVLNCFGFKTFKEFEVSFKYKKTDTIDTKENINSKDNKSCKLDTKETTTILYDIDKLNEALKKANISQKKLASLLEKSPQTINNYLRKKVKMPINVYQKILEILDFETYEDLVKECEIKEAYDVDYIKQYLKKKNISQIELAELIDRNPQTINNYLRKRVKMPINVYQKILEVLGFKTYEDLVKECEIKEEKNENLVTNENIENDKKMQAFNYLKKYLESINMSKTQLEKLTGIPRKILFDYINGDEGIPYSNINLILKALGFKKYEEYQQACNKLGYLEKNMEELTEDELEEDIEVLIEEINEELIESETSEIENENLQLKQFENLETNSMQNRKEKILDLINKRKFFKYLKKESFTENELMIIQLIFLNYDNENLNFESIAKFANVPVLDVIKLYEKCLSLYKNYILSLINFEIEKVLKLEQ